MKDSNISADWIYDHPRRAGKKLNDQTHLLWIPKCASKLIRKNTLNLSSANYDKPSETTTKCVAFIREPYQRWKSGVATYYKNQLRYVDSNAEWIENVLDQISSGNIVLDEHTVKQTEFMSWDSPSEIDTWHYYRIDCNELVAFQEKYSFFMDLKMHNSMQMIRQNQVFLRKLDTVISKKIISVLEDYLYDDFVLYLDKHKSY